MGLENSSQHSQETFTCHIAVKEEYKLEIVAEFKRLGESINTETLHNVKVGIPYFKRLLYAE
jgi:hypothetical protein